MATDTSTNDAVRIQVIQHCGADGGSQCCKFSVDPQLTSLTVLHNLVARAFKLAREFETSYLARDERLPEAVWLPLLSDFDLELAFTRSSVPHLLVKVEAARSVSRWLEQPRMLDTAAATHYGAKLPGLFREKMEKTLGLMQKALNWQEEFGGSSEGSAGEGGLHPPPPLDDIKFQSFLDNVGVLEKAEELRNTVYLVGLEPSLRKVAWKHLLDVYPAGLTGRERLEYMKIKSAEYFELRATWHRHLQQGGQICSEVTSICSMVRKDVLRTDRHHPYYSGPDDNPHTTALYNILTTYCLNHPSVGYCQGMSDLASPLLVTQRDEAHAYVCFTALMARTHPNFHIDGAAMSLKFQHLSEALIYYDADFYFYLQEHQAEDLLFCYRWLLLELKREFAFDDAQLMLEVLWSSLPPRPPLTTLQLTETPFNPEASLRAAASLAAAAAPCSSSRPPAPCRPALRARWVQRISNYSAVCALRRQRSSEAAARGRSKRLTRAHSQPIRARLGDGDKVGQGVGKGDGSKSSKGDGAGLRSQTKAGNRSPQKTTKRDAVQDRSKGNLPAVLSPLSDEVFVTDTAKESSSIVEGEDLCGTPTRKIKNLKEFMELGRSSTISDPSHPTSPSKSPLKKYEQSPVRINLSNLVAKHSNSDTEGCCKVESDVPTIPSTFSNSVALKIPRPTDCPLFSNISKSETDCTLKSCTIVSKETREFPPSGLTPTETACDNCISPDLCLEASNGLSANVANSGDCPLDEPATGTRHREFLCLPSKTSQDSSPSSGGSPREHSLRRSRPVSQVLTSPSNGSTCSSTALCAAESARRCFSESDAGVGMMLDDHEEELLVEVWENPLASSPISGPTSTLPQSSTETNIKLIDSRESNHFHQRAHLTSHSLDCAQSSVSTSYSNPCSVGTSDSNQRVALNNNVGTGWTVSVGGSPPSKINKLPPPDKFGGGNPFLLIVCVTILLQHRNFILSQRLDHNDLAMHFDKLVRKHHVHNVLRQSRLRYQHYRSLHVKDDGNVHEAC